MKSEKVKPTRNKVYDTKAKDGYNKNNKTRNQNLPRSKDPYIRNATKPSRMVLYLLGMRDQNLAPIIRNLWFT